ncbi:MAG TPA: SAM-dependent chlorinase/fluorinase [Candidatus Aminicenantes bacterium]|nr:SAM-dependent chlorinase/fluorinase [Candidatus Aminicenantes bacterium]HPT00321.1 SAM-dependent chlorinase/fluorinase [Candidatus Aminicenantes bacterium]
MKPIVLVTDFGERDYYAGVVKGVIRKISPESPVIDLCHGVPSFYVPAASFILEKSQAYFPSGSIFIAVVDPGVGSERRLLLVSGGERHFFIGPDNGVFTPFFEGEDYVVREIDSTHNFLTTDATTFEARDRMAPIAALLSKGMDPDRLATVCEGWKVDREYRPSRQEDGSLLGRVIYIDKFGNLVTNVSREVLFASLSESGGRRSQVEINGRKVTDFFKCYQEAGQEPFLLFGSHGNLEIACRQGSAWKQLQAGYNQPVRVLFS